MQVTEEMIRIKAYELWEANGKPLGSEEENWFAAQAQLLDNASTIPASGHQSPPYGLRQLTPSQT